MSKTSALFWAPKARFGPKLLELTRASEDTSHEMFSGISVPRHLAVRYAAIESARMVETGSCEEEPAVVFDTRETTVSVSFVPYGGNTPERRAEAMPTCREFYAQLVREMGRKHE